MKSAIKIVFKRVGDTMYFYHQTSDLVRYSNWVQIETFAIWVDIYYPIPNNLSPRGSVTKYRRRIAKRDFAQKNLSFAVAIFAKTLPSSR